MSDLAELKKEVVEARNQAIKTDNQIKNMALNVKQFEERFDTFERRTRMASVGVHIIVAVVIAASAFAVLWSSNSSHAEELTEAKAQATQTVADAAKKQAALDKKLKQIELAKKESEESRHAAGLVVSLLGKRKDKEAAEVLPKLKFERLSELERTLLAPQVDALRRRTAEATYKLGKTLLGQSRHDAGLRELAKSLAIEPEGPFATKAAYLAATSNYSLKRYDKAEPLLVKLLQSSKDRALLDEVRFLLGITLAKLGKKDEAKAALKQATSGPYRNTARSYLSALDAGTPLPGN